MCCVYVLQIFVGQKVYLVGEGGGAYLESNLITQIFVLERQNPQFYLYVLGTRGDK